MRSQGHSENQGVHREVQAERRSSKISTQRTETSYKALQTDDVAKETEIQSPTVKVCVVNEVGA